jgi:hypothetical protein
MKKSLVAVVLSVAALGALGNVGVKLVGALRQVGEIASTNVAPPGAPGVAVARVVAPGEPTVAQRAEPSSTRTESPPGSTELERAPLPGSGFDPEAALRAAAEADPNVAALLDSVDPMVGAAVRQFVYDIGSPGSSTGPR